MIAETGLEWFMLEHPVFSYADACEITDVPERTLQNWANRGLIEIESTGKGTPRRYTSAHVAIITFARELIAIGFETGLALTVASSAFVVMVKQAKEAIKAKTPPAECEQKLLGSVAFITPDRINLKHQVQLIEAVARDQHPFPLDRCQIHLPVGPLLARSIAKALKIETARARLAKSLGAAAVAELSK